MQCFVNDHKLKITLNRCFTLLVDTSMVDTSASDFSFVLFFVTINQGAAGAPATVQKYNILLTDFFPYFCLLGGESKKKYCHR